MDLCDIIYRHVKTGHDYTILDFGIIEATMTPAVIYRRFDGSGGTFIRPAKEFFDGRFRMNTPVDLSTLLKPEPTRVKAHAVEVARHVPGKADPELTIFSTATEPATPQEVWEDLLRNRGNGAALIVCGPQGSGKTTHRGAICRAADLRTINDDWESTKPLFRHALHLTYEPVSHVLDKLTTHYSFPITIMTMEEVRSVLGDLVREVPPKK